MANCIDTNNRHYPKEFVDKTIIEEMILDKLADFMLDYNGNDTTDILTTLYENYKRSFPSFIQSLFDEQKLRNSVLKKDSKYEKLS